MENKLTNAIRNRITGQFLVDIRTIKNHLFDKYGKINESELRLKHDETTKLTYNISDPVNDILNAVKDLCEIAELAQTPYSVRQKVNISYLNVSKHLIFRSDLWKWMRK